MSSLPASWISCELGDLIDYGKTEKVEPEQINPEAWVLELEDVEKDTSKILQRVSFGERQSKSTKHRFQAGDVLYGKLRPYLNKVVRADRPGLCTTEIIPLRPPPEVHAGYLFHWLKHPQFMGYVNAVSHGLTMPRLGTAAGRKAPFILAPRAEQQRIAEKLDALLTFVNACRERLDLLSSIIAKLRQSILSAAMDGELTAEWRDGQDTSHWTAERAADVCSKIQSGGTPKEGFTAEGVPFLKVYNLVEQRLDFEYRPQFVAPNVHTGPLAKSVTLPGDVLMNIVGPPLGKVAVVTDAFPAWNINQAITLFRPSKRITTGWLYIVLRSGRCLETILHETRGSAGQVNVSLTQCRDFVFPVPPPVEQAEIVRRVESLFALADAIEAKGRAIQALVERLTSALLFKAFRGELVPQDPNDEPASILLERVRAATASASPPAKRKVQNRRSDLKAADHTLLNVIDQMGKADFTFDELREHSSRDYESLTAELFALLSEQKSGLDQYFDETTSSMKLRRVRK